MPPFQPVAYLRSIIKTYNICREFKRYPTPNKEFFVSYGHEHFPSELPGPGSIWSGGAVKYAYLDKSMPHSGMRCNILYAVSSSHFAGMKKLLRCAQERGIRVVWNQDGAWFPSAYGKKLAARGNAEMAQLLHGADYVFYQSKFCKFASDHFLGERQGTSEILYNAIDTDIFCPNKYPSNKDLTLLIAGSHHDPYRLTLAIQALKVIHEKRRDVRLIITGRTTEKMLRKVDSLVNTHRFGEIVEIMGPYRQYDAPEIFKQAHILLHTKYTDPCPSVVIEAMACGLPVVYSASGGTPELVGENAGYGVPSVLNWDTPMPPKPEELAEGVLKIADKLEEFSEAARERAVSKFDLKPWIKRHTEVFEYLMGNK